MATGDGMRAVVDGGQPPPITVEGGLPRPLERRLAPAAREEVAEGRLARAVVPTLRDEITRLGDVRALLRRGIRRAPARRPARAHRPAAPPSTEACSQRHVAPGARAGRNA